MKSPSRLRQGQPEHLYWTRKLSDRSHESRMRTIQHVQPKIFDYKTFAGVLVAQREVDSNGDHAYDVAHYTERILVDKRIDPGVFVLPFDGHRCGWPVTVPLEEHDGHILTTVKINGHPYTFLVDTGAQGIVLDSHVAAEQHLKAQGRLEVSGAQRIGGLGFAALDAIQIGSATAAGSFGQRARFTRRDRPFCRRRYSWLSIFRCGRSDDRCGQRHHDVCAPRRAARIRQSDTGRRRSRAGRGSGQGRQRGGALCRGYRE